MRWIIEVDREAASDGLAWAREFFSRYDTSKVDWVRIDLGRGRGAGVYGRCWYPEKGKLYRLSCQVPGPYPCGVRVVKPPIYRREDGSWPEVPEGCERGEYCSATNAGVTKEWYRITGKAELTTISEGIVFIVGHEGFHFLRRSKQIPGRNIESEADAFALRQLAAFRDSIVS
jgi:hypothetical protein